MGLYLVLTTFFLKDYPSTYQEPALLLERDDLPMEEVREGELHNISDRIAESKTWIEAKAKAINLTRMALVVSPLVFGAGCLLYKWFDGNP